MVNTAQMVFTMGLPAAGKSTHVAAVYASTHTVIDPDAVKESHPDYDPKRPELLHNWSKAITDAQFEAALAAGEGNFVVDGTGTNAEKMVALIKRARAAGFEITLVFVRCSLEISLARNAARPRTVPEHVVIEKSQLISTSFELVSPYADHVVVVDTTNN